MWSPRAAYACRFRTTYEVSESSPSRTTLWGLEAPRNRHLRCVQEILRARLFDDGDPAEAGGDGSRCPAAISGAEMPQAGRVGASYPGNATGSEGASRLAIRWKITWLTFSPVRLPSMPTVDTTAIVSRLPGR